MLLLLLLNLITALTARLNGNKLPLKSVSAENALSLTGIAFSAAGYAAHFGYIVLPAHFIFSFFYPDYIAAFPDPTYQYILGIPVSAVTISCFLLIFILSVIKEQRLFVIVLPAAVFSLFYIGIQYFILRRFAAYPLVCEFILLIQAILLLRKKNYVKTKFFWPAVCISLLTLQILSAVVQNKNINILKNEEKYTIPEFYRQWQNAPQYKIKIPDGSLEIGGQTAPLQVVEFIDLQCAFCLKGLSAVYPLDEKIKKHVRYTIMHFPLDSACNSAIKYTINKNSCSLAAAMLAPGGNLLFARRLAYPYETYRNIYGTEIFTNNLLKLHIDEGNRLGITATPALFVNDRPAGPFISHHTLLAFLHYINQQK